MGETVQLWRRHHPIYGTHLRCMSQITINVWEKGPVSNRNVLIKRCIFFSLCASSFTCLSSLLSGNVLFELNLSFFLDIFFNCTELWKLPEHVFNLERDITKFISGNYSIAQPDIKFLSFKMYGKIYLTATCYLL